MSKTIEADRSQKFEGQNLLAYAEITVRSNNDNEVFQALSRSKNKYIEVFVAYILKQKQKIYENERITYLHHHHHSSLLTSSVLQHLQLFQLLPVWMLSPLNSTLRF